MTLIVLAAALFFVLSGCPMPQSAKVAHEAMEERCAWMGSETVLFAKARDQGTKRDQAMQQIDSIDQQAFARGGENRAQLGLPDEKTDLREIVHQIYDDNPSTPSDQLAQKVKSSCEATVRQQ